jgi:hypothetical protein
MGKMGEMVKTLEAQVAGMGEDGGVGTDGRNGGCAKTV